MLAFANVSRIKTRFSTWPIRLLTTGSFSISAPYINSLFYLKSNSTHEYALSFLSFLLTCYYCISNVSIFFSYQTKFFSYQTLILQRAIWTHLFHETNSKSWALLLLITIRFNGRKTLNGNKIIYLNTVLKIELVSTRTPAYGLAKNRCSTNV